MADFNFGDYGPKDKGYLGPNKFKKKKEQPDLRGNIKISREQLQALLFLARQKKENPDYDFEIRIDLSGWDNVDKNGKRYISLGGEVYIPKPEDVTSSEVLQPEEKDEFEDDIPF